MQRVILLGTLLAASAWADSTRAEGDWEVTPSSERALERGLDWLARNQGPEGNWESNDLGLVSMGALAFLAAGHAPGRGRYGQVAERALDYVLRHGQSSGLLNIADPQRDMYNHGLSAFVLGQVYGMTDDPRVGLALDRALALIAAAQCDDGGWDYRALRQAKGHDLSLVGMQAKALGSALDIGLEVPPAVIERATESVRRHYAPRDGSRGEDELLLRQVPGQFTYDGQRATLAMAAGGVVCLQQFGQYDDWRIPKNMEVIRAALAELEPRQASGEIPLGAYTLDYVGQAVYQVGGDDWLEAYPRLRDALVTTQTRAPGEPRRDGQWRDTQYVVGKPGELYATAVGCFILAIPNRYLPILQVGRVEGKRHTADQP